MPVSKNRRKKTPNKRAVRDLRDRLIAPKMVQETIDKIKQIVTEGEAQFESVNGYDLTKLPKAIYDKSVRARTEANAALVKIVEGRKKLEIDLAEIMAKKRVRDEDFMELVPYMEVIMGGPVIEYLTALSVLDEVLGALETHYPETIPEENV